MHPRGPFIRALIVFAAVVLWFFLAIVLNAVIPSPTATTETLVDLAATSIFMIFVLPLVSYRRRDFLIMIIPLYSLYFFGLIVRRLAYLPYRDWPPRADEAARWQQVRHPKEPGALLYVTRL